MHRPLQFARSATARDLLLLALLTLLVCLPGLARMPVIDRDEARYVQSSIQMVETGDYVDIRFQDEPRHKKPVGAYWAQVASLHLTGQADDTRAGGRAIWAHRLPSVLAALVAVIATYFAGLALLGRREAWLGAALLGTSAALAFEAHQAKTDALLLGTCAVALWAVATRRAWPFWLAVAAGVLVKGPVIVGVAGLALLALRLWPGEGRRDTGWLWRPWPILAALAVALPWFVAIGIVSDGAFFAEALGRDFGAKVGSAQETHGGPPGYYLLTGMLMFWPGIAAVPLAAVWAWRERRRAGAAVLLAWLVPMWLVLELVPTKLPHYTLPLYPALALLCGAAAVRLAAPRLRGLGAILLLVGGVGIAFGGLYLQADFSGPSPDGTPLAVAAVMVALAGAAALLWARGLPRASVALSAGVGALFFGAMASDSPALGLTERIVEAARAVDPEARISSPGYREPSMVVWAGTGTPLDVEDVRIGDVLVLGSSGDIPMPRCAGEVRRLEGNHYADGRGRAHFEISSSAACAEPELAAWRRRHSDPRRGSASRGSAGSP